MKIALTGASGLLGSEINKVAMDSGYIVTKITRTLIKPELGLENALQYIQSLKCEVLIHCAANTDVEFCELNKQQCFIDNVLFSELLAVVCQQLNIKLVFISSTGIYGDYQSEPYCEYDDVKATTIHHQSKYLAEKSLQQKLNNVLIIRTGWLFGGPLHSNKNFVVNRINEAENAHDFIESDPTQVGNPTYVVDVAERILLLLQDNISGVFNCVNSGVGSRFDYVSKIIEFSGLNIKVKPSEKKFKRVAPVSFNESAINFKMDESNYPVLPHWELRLLEYLNASFNTD